MATVDTRQSEPPGSPEGRTRRLARFVSELNYGNLPQEVIERTKTCVLDALGSIFLGSTLPWGGIMTSYARATAGRPECTVVGSDARTGASHAALANGTMGHGFEIDDVFIPALQHPGVVVVPAALAAAERADASGQEFLTAVVAGYEVMNRAGRAVGTESHVMRGFIPTGTNGTFGAAAAAGKLLHLDEQALTDALGIAGHQCGGLFEGVKEGSMTKRFNAGWAAQCGIVAADLAKLGFSGPSTVFEGPWGYLKAYSDASDPAPLTAGLGEQYTIMETTFKPYPCCKALHASIDATLELKVAHRFDPGQIAEVVVGGYEKLARMHDIYQPATSMAAQFSIPYVVSVALLKGSPGVGDFGEESIRDREVLAFARKVKVVVDPEVAPYFPANEPSKVTVRLMNGERFSRTVISSKGTPSNPMNDGEIEAKFRSFATLVIPARQADAITRMIRNLERVEAFREFSTLLCNKEG